MHNSTRPKLTDILHNGRADDVRRAWESTEAAADFAPLPAATYTARIVAGELFTAKSGTPGYKLAFKVLDGEHAGRQFWHDVWLTPAAMPMAKRDLGRLGVKRIEQLDKPLPPGIRVKAKVTLHRNDDGAEYNSVRSFEVIGVDGVEDADFAPQTATAEATVGEPDESEPTEAEIDPAARAVIRNDNGDSFTVTGDLLPEAPKAAERWAVGHD